MEKRSGEPWVEKETLNEKRADTSPSSCAEGVMLKPLGLARRKYGG